MRERWKTRFSQSRLKIKPGNSAIITMPARNNSSPDNLRSLNIWPPNRIDYSWKKRKNYNCNACSSYSRGNSQLRPNSFTPRVINFPFYEKKRTRVSNAPHNEKEEVYSWWACAASILVITVRAREYMILYRGFFFGRGSACDLWVQG